MSEASESDSNQHEDGMEPSTKQAGIKAVAGGSDASGKGKGGSKPASIVTAVKRHSWCTSGFGIFAIVTVIIAIAVTWFTGPSRIQKHVYDTFQQVADNNASAWAQDRWENGIDVPEWMHMPGWMQRVVANKNGTTAYGRTPDRVGRLMAQKGLRAKYPIILVPGFVTSGLEMWAGHECFKGNFRQKVWTKANMGLSFLTARLCWMQHLSLNYTTGLDPEGIRIRNAQGLDAIDFFFRGYDVWAKTIEALADIGYDATSMIAMPYDWRLSLPNLELRDGYFTKLKMQTEMFRTVYDERVMIAGHSWGDNVVRGFLQWADERDPGWVDRHVAVVFNCAGTTLGTPKAATSLLSGELRESTQLSGLSYMIGESLLGKEDRTTIWRTWGSPVGMLPIGGTSVWGNSTWAPDETANATARGTSLGAMFTVKSVAPKPIGKATLSADMKWLSSDDNRTITDVPAVLYQDAVSALSEIARDGGPTYLCHMKAWGTVDLPENITEQVYSVHGSRQACGEELAGPNEDPLRTLSEKATQETERPVPSHGARQSVRMYHPLRDPLPKAPNMRIYCAYGHGTGTERAYHYKHVHMPVEPEQCPAMELGTSLASDQVSAGAHWAIDKDAHDPKRDLVNGVVLGPGDGTVPLISLGAPCYHHWRTKELNPGGVKVVIREYADQSHITPLSPRGGDKASTHVELLGHSGFIKDFLHAAAGWHEPIDEDIITSDIANITKRMLEHSAHVKAQAAGR